MVRRKNNPRSSISGFYRLGAIIALVIAITYFHSEKVPFPLVPITTPKGQWSPSSHEISTSGIFRPSDVPPLPIYSDYQNASIVINGRTLQVAEGSAKHIGVSNGVSEFAVLPMLVTSNEVDVIMGIANGPNAAEFDIDPDPVDGMSSYRFYIEDGGISSDEVHRLMKKKDANATKDSQEERKEMRSKLKEFMDPIIRDRLTAYVRYRYPDTCGDCTACQSLIRRYNNEERVSHDAHQDGHSKVSVLISLSQHEVDYRGGVYVADSRSEKKMVALGTGDAIIHESSLLHGVKVDDSPASNLWHWIVWFRDSEECEDKSKDSLKDCAPNDAFCLSLHADSGAAMRQEDIMRFHEEAAKMGLSTSMVRLARAYLKQLPSNLPLDFSKAASLYREAVAVAREPDAMYGLANLLLQGILQAKITKNEGDKKITKMGDMLQEVAYLLEGAAKAGHAFAMFNLGVMHLHGYAMAWGGEKDMDLAALWFETSGIPEGFHFASLCYSSHGNEQKSKDLAARAKKLGYGTQWRKKARELAGSGGASGVDINMAWPAFFGTGTVPDKV